MRAPFITLSPEELLALCPEYWQKVRDSATPKHVLTGEPESGKGLPIVSTHLNQITTLPFSRSISTSSTTTVKRGSLPAPASAVNKGYIIPDIYETYLKNLPQGQQPCELTVTKESHALRSIIMVVDNQEQVETIIDPGSQIIAMADSVCHELGLIYDPTICYIRNTASDSNGLRTGLRTIGSTITHISLPFHFQYPPTLPQSLIHHLPLLLPDPLSLAADDAQPGNPNKTPKMSMFSITQARGRLRGGL